MINEKNISVALRKLGIPPSLMGFDYIMTAIKLTDENNLYRHYTSVLYAEIAKRYNIKPMRCERCIRHAIDVSFKYAGSAVLEEIFGSAYSPEKGKPTNCEFLGCLYEYLKYEEDGDD